MARRIALPLALLALLTAGLLTWRQQRANADLETMQQNLLCSQCGFEAQLTGPEQRALMTDANAAVAIAPDFGPGLRCPRCSVASFYAKPVTCRKCSAKFLRSRNRQFNTIDIKCPKCGWEG